VYSYVYTSICIVRFSRDGTAYAALQATKAVCRKSRYNLDPKYDFK
jgi:hypothetical protein